ncbi:MAG: phosphatase PAP2 family protein [Dysgonamonadaceae bacterium]|jgi:membrane-associated phospholipid phosphatase|nr:phosphatase PAP2 family protein [Dysgonamonadaceae bacterium]
MEITVNAALRRWKTTFFTMEKLTIVYALVSGLIVVGLWRQLDDPMRQILARIIIVGIIIVLSFSDKLFRNKKFSGFIRVCFQLSLLSYWYPDTYELNKFFPNLDSLFASLEQSVFGFQPALDFAPRFPSLWISEAFHLGYFSYYPIICLVTSYCYFFRPNDFKRFSMLLLGSFFVYYLIYIFLPVAGPQFYFYAIGMKNVQAANFPAIGDYFRYHRELLPNFHQTDGFFYRLVEMSQKAGERPTAAFPSSHVGISTVLTLWLLRNNLKWGFLLIPFYVLLCGATVYIQAHYAIDVLAGWITGFLFFGLFYILPLKKAKINS